MGFCFCKGPGPARGWGQWTSQMVASSAEPQPPSGLEWEEEETHLLYSKQKRKQG